MDALSDVLRVTQLNGGVFLHAEFTAPWCIASWVSPEMCAPFTAASAHMIPYHYVVEGELRISLEGQEPVSLQSGDMVLFPGNDVHVMGSDLALPATRVREVLADVRGEWPLRLRYGGGGAAARLVCGYLGCDSPRGNPVLSTLPRLMKIGVEQSAEAAWFRTVFEYAANEVGVGGPGSTTVLAKVSELLFVEAVRRYVRDLPAGESGWLAGLQDRVVARALTLLHRQIARDWTVDDLGREVGLSRSALADRFARVIGVPPIQYLAQWRLQVAAQSLRATNNSLARIAERVGYQSEAAFSRAFKKAFGAAPATWRRLNA